MPAGGAVVTDADYESLRFLRDAEDAENWERTLGRLEAEAVETAAHILERADRGHSLSPSDAADVEDIYSRQMALMRAAEADLPVPAVSRMRSLQAQVDEFASRAAVDPVSGRELGEDLVYRLRTHRAECQEQMDEHDQASRRFESMARRAEDTRSGALSPQSNQTLDDLGQRLFGYARIHRDRAYDIEDTAAASQRLLYAVEDRLAMLEQATR